MTETIPQLAKLQKINLFDFDKNLVSDYTVAGSIKKSFKFELKGAGGKSLFETDDGDSVRHKVPSSSKVQSR